MEELAEFAKTHLGWIHAIEQMANRRITDEEVAILRDLTIVNDFDSRLESLATLTEEINETTRNFVEGIVPDAQDYNTLN
jgi:hypothetical protein